jgi:hypothetical protein
MLTIMPRALDAVLVVSQPEFTSFVGMNDLQKFDKKGSAPK